MLVEVSRRLRGAAALLIGALMLLAPAANAQVGGLAGTWRGFAQGVTFNLVVGADGSYSEQAVSGPYMTLQQGYIQQTGPSVITFVVQNWEPKQLPVYHPTGTVGGYTTYEPTPKPPGGTWRIQFNSANSFSMQDVNLGGVVTFQRVG